ncbi:unnamed protein product [Calypogeia fissa]
MKEKEPGPSLGVPYMSPLVKQDLARLDKDGESRRSAMNSLKQFVENLDPGTMPRFLAQVSETRDQGASRSYAISLYEEVARVHGKLIIPHISRVMATVTRSLSSSGSSPHLHQACAKVVSAVARFSVEEGSPEQADGILRDLCDPLLSVLTGKLEPLAAGAAVCLQALVECEKWKYASDEIVNETCLKTTVAIGEKITRTVAHMQLARSLATTNPSFFDSFGVALLRSGSEVLRETSASGTWQRKACAARLLQAVLPIVDKATLASELEHIIEALDDCKHDRMAHVRAAVTEALKTAKLLSSNDGRVSSDGLSCASRPSSEVSSGSGQGGKQGLLKPTTSGFGNPYPSLRGEKMGCNQQSSDTDGSSFVMPGRRKGRVYTYLENSAITAHRKREGADIPVEEVSSNGTIVDMEAETDRDSNQGLLTKESRYTEVGDVRYDNVGSVSSSRFSHRQTPATGLTRQSVREVEGRASDSRTQSVATHSVDEYLHTSSGVFAGHDCKETLDFLTERQSSHSSLPNLRNPTDVSGPQKQRLLITGEDFLPFSTPRRLVRSLQSNLSSPLVSSAPKNKVTKSFHEVGNMSDKDFESSSEAGWSVRDNPIASDESAYTDSEGEDREQRGNVGMQTNSGSRHRSTGFDPKIGLTKDCKTLSSASAKAAESFFCLGTTKDPELKSFNDNAEVLNDELDHKVHDSCFSPGHHHEGSLSMVEECCPSQCTCCAKTSRGTHLSEAGDHLVARGEHDFEKILTSQTEKVRTVGVLRKTFQHFVEHVSGKLLRSLQACTDSLLTGFLLFILAVPFAIVISKILWSHLDRPGLIPT